MPRFAKESGITFGAQLLIFPVAALTSILMARVLGPAGKGTLVLLMMVPALTALVAELGLGLSNAYHVGSGKYRPKLAAGNTLILSLVLGGSFTAVFFLVKPWLSTNALRGVPGDLLAVAALCSPVFVLTPALNSIFQGMRRFKQYNATRLFSRTSRLVALALFFLAIGTTVEVGLYGFVASAVMLLVFLIVVVRKYIGFEFSLSRAFARDSLSYGLKVHLGNMMDYLNYRLDVLIVNLYWGVAEVGLYTVSVGVAELVFYIPFALSAPLFPRSASFEEKDAATFAALVLRNTVMISAVAAILIGVAAPLLLNLAYGDAFAQSVPALRILLIGIVALSAAKVVLSHFAGRGHPMRSTVVVSITLAFTIVLDFALIPKWGKVGAATASTIAYTVASAIALTWFRKDSGLTLREMLIPTMADVRRYIALPGELRRRDSIGDPNNRI